MEKYTNILSLNARGLRENSKRKDFLYWINQKNIDVCMIQETYWTNEFAEKLQREWEGKAFINCGTQHSRGTAILLKKHISILGIHKSEDSRIILINVEIQGKSMTLINIYAPNTAGERKTFFAKLKKWIERYAINDEQIILGGDFNHTEDNNLDRRCTGNNKIIDGSANSYLNLKNTKKLKDIWRIMHPKKKEYTYKDISRLDKFLISDDLTQVVQRMSIITSGVKSDHKAIQLCMNLNKSERGPGRWKLNVSILEDKIYQQQIKELVKNVREESKDLSNQQIWEMCKVKIREHTITYCKRKQQIKKNIVGELEQQIRTKEKELINSNYARRIEEERDELIRDMHNLVHGQSVGAQIRSRAQWIEQGEKSTKYFFNLEKHNAANNTIKTLEREDGSYTKNETEVIEEGRNFYKKLYTKESSNEEDMTKYLEDIDERHILKDDDSKALEGIITQKECEEALRNMKDNKSPGSDGLPPEFYKTFWQDIKNLVIGSLNAAYEKGELSPTQKRGHLTLLFKKNEKELLKNWRPISLLNTDYKILTHVLANRLKGVIHKIILKDQNGYIKGRNIGYNIRLIQDVIEYFEEGNIEGAIIFLDFHKAFDTVNHDFLKSVLRKFNFGSSFTKWVDIIYNKAESCFTNNGWTSRPFKIERGIRQGCPLSALLFILVVEILADKIRENKNNGLEIKVKEDTKYIQIAQLVDDTTIFLKNEQAVHNCLNIVNMFSSISGLKLNMDKTEGLWLGRGINRNDNLAGINWEKNQIKALGVHFGYNNKEMEKHNWSNKISGL